MPNLEKLPGLENIISDGGLAIPPSNPLLNASILVIGFANNGPVNTPVVISDPNTAFARTKEGAIQSNALFGYNNLLAGANLGLKYREAQGATVTGTPDIRVMRLGLPTITNDDTAPRGDGRASGFITTGGGTKAIRLVGKWAGTLYHEVHADVTSVNMTLTFGDTTFGSQEPVIFTHGDYDTLTDYVNAINLSNASQYVIAEVIEESVDAEQTVTAAGSTTNISQNIRQVNQLDLVRYINPAITGGTGLKGVDNVPVDSLIKLGGVADTFTRGKLVAGNASYQAYTGGIAGASIAGGAVFVPKYVYNDVGQYVSGGNNPFPISLPLGATFEESGTGESTKMGADYSEETQDGTQIHNMILGGLRVNSIDKVTSTSEHFLENSTDEFLVTDDGTGTHAVTTGITLTNSGGTGGATPDTDYEASTDNNHFLFNDETVGGAFQALIVNTPTGQDLPGGFYVGVSTANNTGTPTVPQVFYWDYADSDGTGAEWVQAAVITNDGTADLTVSGFIGFVLTGRMVKAAAAGKGMRWAITQEGASTGDADAGKINTIIPMHPESYARPVNDHENGNFADVNLNVAWGVGKSNTAGIQLSAPPAGWGTKPTKDDIGALTDNTGWIYGNAAIVSATWQPTIITFKIPAQKTITRATAQYYQNVETTSTGYGPNLDNLIAYDSGINGNNTIEVAEEARVFGYTSVTDFASDVVTNGGLKDVWGWAYIAVPRDVDAAAEFFNFDSGTVETGSSLYQTNHWRVKYQREITDGDTIDAVVGNLGGTGGLGGQSGNNFAALGTAEKRQALIAALNLIDGYEADIYVLGGMHLDETFSDENGQTINAGYHTILHDFLTKTIRRNHEAVGVLSVKPFDKSSKSLSAVDVARHFNNLTSTAAGGNSAANIMASFEASYGCISVTCGEPSFNAGGLQYYGTGEAAYAGLMSSIPVADSTTNKAISGTNGLRYSFLREQHEGLMRHRYAILGRKSAGDGVLVIDGVTAAKNNGTSDRSDFVRISTVRVVFELLQAVRAVAEPYIGRPNAPWSHNQLRFDVQKTIDDFKDANYIVDGAAQIQANLADRVNGNVFIKLSIVPPLEIRRIIVSTSLRPSL